QGSRAARALEPNIQLLGRQERARASMTPAVVHESGAVARSNQLADVSTSARTLMERRRRRRLEEVMGMKRMASVIVLACVVLGVASGAQAQAPRNDVIWARNVGSQTITLNGILGEAAWSQAQSYTIKYRVNAGDPGSGWKDEAGIAAGDPLFATLKFLVKGDSLYMGLVVRERS